MNELFVIDREFLFKTSVHEITSISIEHNYDINGSRVEGDFIISGDYRIHEISINKEDFSYKLPFSYELRSNINLDTVEVEIKDFTYELNNEDELKIHIEYLIKAEEALLEFEDEEKLNDFLTDKNVEIVDLKEETPILDNLEDNRNDPKVDENLILNSINEEDEYIKYHVHTVTMEDSIETICNKYNININLLKKYNTFENLELNMKLIIPSNEEL